MHAGGIRLTDMRVHHYRKVLNDAGIARCEDFYGAKYVGTFEIPGTPVRDVFYVADPDKSIGHDHYFGIHWTLKSHLMISRFDHRLPNGDRLAIAGFVEDGVFYYSGCRHDCVFSPGGRMIDGGLDYTRTNFTDVPVIHLRLADVGPEFTDASVPPV